VRTLSLRARSWCKIPILPACWRQKTPVRPYAKRGDAISECPLLDAFPPRGHSRTMLCRGNFLGVQGGSSVGPRWSRWRTLLSWFCTLLLSVEILAGAFLPASTDPTAQTLSAQELLGDRVVVCTAGGMVVFDRNGQPVDSGDGQGSGHGGICAFCLPLMHGGIHLPAIQAMDMVPVFQDQLTLPPAESPVLKRLWLSSAAAARAPPQS